MSDIIILENFDDLLAIPPLRVLAADDSPTNRRLLENYLSIANLDVHFADNGLDAVQIYQDILPDMVLMDIFMPEMSGFEATSSIRSYEWLHALDRCPIIALTAGSDSVDRQACLEADMDDFLTKPVDRAVLWETIDKWSSAEKMDTLMAEQAPLTFKETDFSEVPSSSPNIDTQHVQRMREGLKADIFADLVRQYYRDTEMALEVLEHAVASSNAPEAQRILHLLKGCSANFGAVAFSELCEAGKSKMLDGGCDASCDTRQLKQAFTRSKEQLEAILLAS